MKEFTFVHKNKIGEHNIPAANKEAAMVKLKDKVEDHQDFKPLTEKEKLALRVGNPYAEDEHATPEHLHVTYQH